VNRSTLYCYITHKNNIFEFWSYTSHCEWSYLTQYLNIILDFFLSSSCITFEFKIKTTTIKHENVDEILMTQDHHQNNTQKITCCMYFFLCEFVVFWRWYEKKRDRKMNKIKNQNPVALQKLMISTAFSSGLRDSHKQKLLKNSCNLW
jgi:hypothetical protein